MMKQKKFILFGSVSIAGVVLFASILVLINYLSYRHFYRRDLTKSKVYSVSEKTRKIIGGLEDDIHIYVFFPNTSQLFSYIKFTVDELKRFNSHIKIEFIDVDKDLLKVQEYKNRFKLSSEEYIVVSKGDRFRVLTVNDIAEYKQSGNSFMETEPQIKGFKGEEAIVASILSVDDDSRIKVYFTAGHGEKDIDDYESETGYANVRKLLRHNNYDSKKIVLADKKDVPSDANLLIVAGASQNFTQSEKDIVNRYLKGGNPMMFLSDPETFCGLEQIIKDYGIELGDDVVVDPTQCVPFSSPAYILADVTGTHAITKPLDKMIAMFFLSRSVRLTQTAENVHSLIQTTKGGWGETDPEEDVKKDKSKDLAGPVSIAVATEQNNTRLVVFGDSDFASNTQIGNLANADLFINSVSWLLQKENTISIGPKLFERKTIAISNNDMKRLTLVVIFLFPLVTLFTGISIWRIRRK